MASSLQALKVSCPSQCSAMRATKPLAHSYSSVFQTDATITATAKLSRTSIRGSRYISCQGKSPSCPFRELICPFEEKVTKTESICAATAAGTATERAAPATEWCVTVSSQHNSLSIPSRLCRAALLLLSISVSFGCSDISPCQA